MKFRRDAISWAVAAILVGCGGSKPGRESSVRPTDRDTDAMTAAAKRPTGHEDAYGPLDVGGDYLTYRKLTAKPFLSLVHGNRWVDVYANARGADAYLSGAEIPVGTVIVKTSWQDDHHAPSGIAGPIFIMEKRAPGYAPDHGDWYYALHWAQPPAAEAKRFGGPVYWRGQSPRVAYCWECHDSYDRGLGGLVPSSDLPR